MKRRGNSNKGNFVWTSYSDLSTGVMLSFVLILLVFIFQFNEKKEELDDYKTFSNKEKVELVNSSIKATKRLNKAFADVSTHIKKHGNDKCNGANFQSIPLSNTLRVQFAKNSSWFKSGKSTLTKQGVTCLTYFIPYFLKKIYRKDQNLKGILARVIVEGHTNSVPFRGSKDSFYDNMELSQRRALQTVNFMMKIASKMKNEEITQWIISRCRETQRKII